MEPTNNYIDITMLISCKSVLLSQYLYQNVCVVKLTVFCVFEETSVKLISIHWLSTFFVYDLRCTRLDACWLSHFKSTCVPKKGILKGGHCLSVVSKPSKCLQFITFREGCFVMHIEYKYFSEALETFYYHEFYKR